MAVDEEYLDNLLKTMTDNEENESTEKSMLEAGETSGEGVAYDLQSLLGDADAIDKASSGMLEEALSVDDDWKFSLDDILAQAGAENPEDNAGHVVDLANWEKEETPAETAFEEPGDVDTDTGMVEEDSFLEEVTANEDHDTSEFYENEDVPVEENISEDTVENEDEVFLSDDQTDKPDMDMAYEDTSGIDEPISLDNISEDGGDAETYIEENNADQPDPGESMADTDLELAEINGLLKNTEKREAADDDMLALLEGVGSIQMDNSYDEDDAVFDIFGEGALGEENDSHGENEAEDEMAKDGKKKKKKRLGRKKKKESAAQEVKGNAAQDELDLDHLFNEALGSEGDGAGKKKAGFFARAMEYLTQEEDDWEEELKENAEGAEEDDKKAASKDKKKKKADKKKKKGKNKGAAEGEQDSEENGEDEGEGAPKSKKKPKKEKKEKKEKPPKEKTKSVKVLSTKKLLVLVAFCATIVASVLLLANFLPEYADKQEANDAFYAGDYEKVYQLLYDKQLNESDRIIFGRAKVLLKLERKLQSYENNIALGREVEALDGLMRGMKQYEELISSDVYGAREELDAIYQQICQLLENQYGVTPEMAAQINAYDEITYTKQLHALVEGTEL